MFDFWKKKDKATQGTPVETPGVVEQAVQSRLKKPNPGPSA